ncbi:hypothetical protein jhhlp_001870 [Lomentospora prolificans]|uniref:Uncharacterized protein n=1 Tax=Lomentospora prolificans TaxID=41688 RepID=A0A2N3NCF4_9PEZI|nr:hypothetical protein jhhlp_001870 [Lomentospora prolificans]
MPFLLTLAGRTFRALILGPLYLFVPLVIAHCLYRLYIHPLARVPGPRLAALSNFWHAYQARNGRMRELGKTLHRRYGPVVRVGPDEVWFDSVEGFKHIYSPGSDFEKSDFYCKIKLLTNTWTQSDPDLTVATALTRPQVNRWLEPSFPDSLDFLSERDVKRYRIQRRLVGPIYHISNLKRFETAVDDVIRKSIVQLRSLDGAAVDLKEWMHIITVECLGAAVLSWSPGLLKQKSDGGSGPHSYIGWRKKSVFGLFPLIVLLECVCKSVGRLFAICWGVTYQAPKGFKPFFTGVHRQTKRRLARIAKGESARTHQDLLADLISLHESRPEFTQEYLKRMTVTNFGAGHETMTSTLTSAVSMICSHPETLKRVLDEISDVKDPTRYDNRSNLTYTQASIKEAQRLFPVIGMSLPRKVPAQGFHAHGYYFPAGTTVGCNPVSLHMNKDVFGSDADDFRPGRWLEREDIREMEKYNLTWGGGSRTCPGRQLAELIVPKITVALLNEFRIEVEVPPEAEMPVYFMAMMSGVRARFLSRT